MRTKDEVNERRQREHILKTAWSLFRRKGYQNVTMDDILAEAECSKGRFYYYFHAKAELLDTLYELFDEQYDKVYGSLDPALSAEEKIRVIHRFVLGYMSREIGVDLLTHLYLSQLQRTTNIEFWSPERGYGRILREILAEGQKNGEMRCDMTAEEMTEDLIALERGQLIDWCLQGGSYPLEKVGSRRVSLHCQGYKKEFEGT